MSTLVNTAAAPAAGAAVVARVEPAVRMVATLAWLIAAFVLWPDPSWRAALLLAGAVVAWTVEILPDYVVALALVVAWNLTGAGPTTASVAGFVSPTWFLLLGSLALGAGLARSGLLERLALGLLLLFPATFRGQAIALAVGGLLMTPCLPMNVGRCTMTAPVVAHLAGAMGYRAGTLPAAGLGLAAFLGAGLLGRGFLTGATLNLVAWSLLDTSDRLGWVTWMIAALPMTIVLFGGSLAIILAAFRPAVDRPITRAALERRFAELGRPAAAEVLTGAIALAALVGFAIAPYVGLDPAWVACAGAVVLAAAGVLPRDVFRTAVDWPLVLFIGVVLGLPSMIEHAGFAPALAAWLPGTIEWTAGAAGLAVAALFVIATALRFVLSEWVAVPLLTVTLVPVGAEIGLQPGVVALIVLASANLWLFPYQFTSYAAFYAGSAGALFTHRQVRAFSAATIGLTLLGLLAAVPLWRVLGLVE